MPLESLSQPFNPDEPGRKLREVQVEQVPDREYTALERFDALKKLPIYDEFGNWHYGVKNGKLEGWGREVQNLGLVCELALGHSIQKREKDYVETSLNLPELHGQQFWNALLALCWYDKASAKTYYAHHANEGMWSDDLVIRKITLYIGILLEDSVAVQEAKNQIKETNGRLNLLLTQTLLDSEVNPQEALTAWEEAKTQYYDAGTQLWHYGNGVIEGYCDTTPQLLAVLVQARLEAKGLVRPKIENEAKIPEERNF